MKENHQYVAPFEDEINSLPQGAVAAFVREHVDVYVSMWHPLISKIYQSHGITSRIIEVDDMEQEAVLKVLSCIGRYDPVPQSGDERSNYQRLNNFMITCIRRELISQGWRNSFAPHIPSGSMREVNNELKERCKPSSRGLEELEANEPDVIEATEARDLIDRYDQDNILFMYYMRGLTQREIALRLDKPVSTSTISRRMNNIQDSIREEAKSV